MDHEPTVARGAEKVLPPTPRLHPGSKIELATGYRLRGNGRYDTVDAEGRVFGVSLQGRLLPVDHPRMIVKHGSVDDGETSIARDYDSTVATSDFEESTVLRTRFEFILGSNHVVTEGSKDADEGPRHVFVREKSDHV